MPSPMRMSRPVRTRPGSFAPRSLRMPRSRPTSSVTRGSVVRTGTDAQVGERVTANAVGAAGLDARVVLDHAGPRASGWMPERAVAATEAPDVVTGRRPVALDEAGWSALGDAYARAAALCRAASVPAILGVDDDGLLQATL